MEPTKIVTAQVIPAAGTAHKLLYGIRHGQAWHNVLFNALGKKAYSEYEDTTLTVEGMRQAAEAIAPNVDLVFVSPLMRTLQTAQLMFPNTPQIALECLKEYPQHTDQCNRRSKTSFLTHLFPNVNFSDLDTESQSWPNDTDYDENVQIVKEMVMKASAERIAIVSHSSWLKYWMNGSVESLPELVHCQAYTLDLEK